MTKRLTMVAALVLLMARLGAAQSIVGDRLVLAPGLCTESSGTGSPEAVVVGSICDRYIRTDGSTTTPVIYVKESGSGTTGWVAIPSAPGTVSSVGLSLPAVFSVTGSPVTTTGTLTATWVSPGSNTVLYSAAGSPAFSGTPTLTSLVLNSTLGVSGAATLSSTLGVTGVATFGNVVNGLGSGSVQTGAAFATRGGPNGYEWGHANAAGFASTLGNNSSSGNPYLAFNGEAGTSANTYKTRGVLASILRSDLAGGFIFGTVGSTSADNQTLVQSLSLSSVGAAVFTGGITATTGTLSSTLGVSGAATFSSTSAHTGDATFAANAGTSSFVSQTTGWRIDNGGRADFRYLYTDEQRSKLFTADLESVLAGSERITKSFSTISQTFTCPALGSTATLWVKDAPTFGDAAIFVSGDSVVIHNLTRTTFGPFTVSDCVGVVTSYTDGTAGNAGQQSWTFTRNTSTNGGAMTASTTVAVDALVQDFGTTGNGYLEATATDGAAGVNSPYYQCVTWATAPVSANLTTRCRLGNLKGITGTTEFGLLAGSYGSTNGTFFRASDQNFDLHGITAKWWDAATNVVTIAPNSGSPYIGLGNPAPSACCTTAGIFLGWDHAATKAKASFYSDANNFLTWDGAKLTWKGTNSSLDGSGNLTVTGGTVGGWTLSSTTLTGTNVTLNSNGSIYSGASDFSTGTGWWLDYNAGTPRFRVGDPAAQYVSWDGTDVKIHGKFFTVDANGQKISIASSANDARSYAFTPVLGTSGVIRTEASESSGVTNTRSIRVVASDSTNDGTWDVLAGIGAAAGSNSASFSADAWDQSTKTSATVTAIDGATTYRLQLGPNTSGAGLFLTISGGSKFIVDASGNTSVYGTFRTGITADATTYTQTNANLLAGNLTEAAGIVGGTTLTNENYYLKGVADRKATVQVANSGTNGGTWSVFTKPDGSTTVLSALTVNAAQDTTLTGSINPAKSYIGRAGISGSAANAFNIFWTGSNAQLWIDTTNVGNITVSSDARVKKNIRPIDVGLAEVLKLNVHTFEWATKDPHESKRPQYGLIAQEVDRIIPNLVTHSDLKTNLAPDGLYRVDYVELVPVLVRAVQQLTDQVAVLQAKVKAGGR